MKIVLKDADFSQSGIPTPHEVVLDGSKNYNVFTGTLKDNSDPAKGADVSKIPTSNKKLNYDAGPAAIMYIMFFDSNDTYLGIASRDGSARDVIMTSGTSARIDQYAHYMKPVTESSMTEMTEEEVTSMLANFAYWKLGVVVSSGNISSAELTLEIVE